MPVAQAGLTHRYEADPGLYLALRQMPLLSAPASSWGAPTRTSSPGDGDGIAEEVKEGRRRVKESVQEVAGGRVEQVGGAADGGSSVVAGRSHENVVAFGDALARTSETAAGLRLDGQRTGR